VQLLLSKGADPNMQDGDGVYPIMYAGSRNTDDIQEIIKLLVSSGAKLNVANSDGSSVLHVLVKLFLETTPSLPDVDTIDKRLAFYDSYYAEKYVNTAKYLLSEGIDPNKKDKNGETPLSLLINGFPALKKEDEQGRHPLYLKRAEYAVYLANTLIGAKATMDKPKVPLDFWLVPLVGLTGSQIDESLISHCARMDYFDYDYIYTSIMMNCDKSYKSEKSGSRAYPWLLVQMQLNVPMALELVKTLKEKDVNINDKIFTENAALFKWLNIDIENWSFYKDMYSLEGAKLDVSKGWDSRSICFLIVSRIEDYNKLLDQLK
jgi:hypothetical protein